MPALYFLLFQWIASPSARNDKFPSARNDVFSPTRNDISRHCEE